MGEHSDDGPRPCVCCFDLPRVEAERDRLRAVVDAEGGTVEIGGQVMTQAQYDAARFPLIDERDRLRAVVAEVVFHIGPVAPADLPRDAASGFGIVPYEQVPRLVDQVVAERDRLRAVVDALNKEHAALWRVVNALRLHEQTVAANQDGAEQAIADRWQAVEQALDQLDGSGDIGGVVPPVHGRGDRSTPHTSATGTDTVGGAQGYDPNVPRSSASAGDFLPRERGASHTSADADQNDRMGPPNA